MISEFMTGGHRHCDELFACAEQSASQGDLSAATAQFKEFHDNMEHHFTMEEGTLFVRIEEATGNVAGPTTVMRAEHQQMRSLMGQMAEALDSEDGESFLDDCEAILILMQQHNLKEENILYPMADQLLAHDGPNLLEQLRSQQSA